MEWGTRSSHRHPSWVPWWREGQQGAVGDRLPSHLWPVVAVQLPVQRSGEVSGGHEEQGSWKVTQRGQGVVVRRPSFFEMRHGQPGVPVPLQGEAIRRWLRRNPMYLSPRPGVCWRCGARVGGGRGGRRSKDMSPLHALWGSGAAGSHFVVSASHGRSGPAPQITVGRGWVCGPHPSSATAAYCVAGVLCARAVAYHRLHSCAHSAPIMCASHAVMELRATIHGGKSAPRRCFERLPGRSP